MTADISTSFLFLKNEDKWKDEKPYSIMYQPPEGLERNNFSLERKHNIEVRNIRELDEQPSIDKHGFALISIEPGSLKCAEFDDKAKVTSHFLPTAAKAVKNALKASRVQFFDVTVSNDLPNTFTSILIASLVRRRHPEFPRHVGTSYAHLQPTSIVHIDTTQVDADGLLGKLNPSETKLLREKKWQWFNLWVPLKGPIRDYPLALLDARTVHPETDLASGDTIHPDVVHETYQLYHNENHHWYYAKDQMPHEGWLFIQATSGENALPGVAHSSFDYPSRTSSDALRESIECRGFALYND